MRRRTRIALTGTTLISAALFISLLTSFSTASEGPIGRLLDRLGAAVGSLEHGIRQQLGGPGRSEALAWFAPFRDNLDRLRQPDSVLLGVYDDYIPSTFEGVSQFEQAIGTTVPLVQVYTAWGDKPDQRFPWRLATAIWDMGSVPVITWEPWLTDFESGRHPSLPLREMRDAHGLAAIARGDYDFYVDTWAAEAARFGRPLYLRWAHEMNDPYRYPWGPQNNTKEEFTAAWRHVVDRFRLAGANKVIWVWSPHVAYEYWELYYPGASYVDWIATGALNFGAIANWSQWWPFRDLFGLKYDMMTTFKKPIMVAEFGSLAVGGDRAGWYQEALTDLPTRYPSVKALLFFNVRSDQTVTYQRVDWSVADDDLVAKTVRRAISPWIHADGTNRTRSRPSP